MYSIFFSLSFILNDICNIHISFYIFCLQRPYTFKHPSQFMLKKLQSAWDLFTSWKWLFYIVEIVLHIIINLHTVCRQTLLLTSLKMTDWYYKVS